MSRSATENLHLTRNGSVQKSYLQDLRLTFFFFISHYLLVMRNEKKAIGQKHQRFALTQRTRMSDCVKRLKDLLN